MENNTEKLLLRTRAVLDEWFVLVVVALLALSLLGGWGVFTALAAEQTAAEVEEPDETWSTTAGFEHYATVEEENEVFEVGTVLTDRSTYFTTVSPELEGEFQYAYEASSGDVAIDMQLERVLRSVDDEGEVEHWVVNETLDTSTAESVGPGDEQTAAFSVDVPVTESETERIEESLGASPGTVETVVVAEVTMSGTVNGEPVERTDVYELEIDPDGDVYHVDGPVDERWTSDSTAGVENEETAASSSGFFGPVSSTLVLLASLGALGVLVSAKSRGMLAPSDAEREKLRIRAEQEEFDEWISRGSIPDELRDRSQIEVASLEDLVDVAIDCDRRVLEDADAYYVVDGELLYCYEPDSEPDVAGHERDEATDDVASETYEDDSTATEASDDDSSA